MLNDIQKDLRELLELVRYVATYDGTLTASQMTSNSIQPGTSAI